MKEFDIIIIGGGHQALVLGALLAKYGKEVMLFERNFEFGGGACTQEPITPGFYHNVHSIYHRAITTTPPFVDLNLQEHVNYVEAEIQNGMPLKDGRALIIYQDMDKTCESIAQFSRKDAETYRRLRLLFEPFMKNVYTPLFYSPPRPKAERDAILAKTEAGRLFKHISEISARQAADELFESDPVKAMFCFLTTVLGITDDRPAALGEFTINFARSNRAVCVGGSHNLGHALHKVFVMYGGMSAERCHVEKILIENGRAVGVRLREDAPFPEKEVLARDAVVSAIDLKQTFLKLIDREELDPALIEKVKGYKAMEWSLFGLHLELKEPPHHTAAENNPDLDIALKWNIGYEHPDLLAEHWREIRAGELPQTPGYEAGCLTVFDPNQAPPGRHTAFAWQFVPYRLKDGGPQAWDRVKWDYAEHCIKRWAEYAPNLTHDNITGVYCYTPIDIERRHINMAEGDWLMGRHCADQLWENRPLPELSQYRTPIKGLYLGGSCCHPRASVTGGPGYNAAGVIAEDLGFKKWWNPPQLVEEW